MLGIPPELLPYIYAIVSAVVGYMLRHYHIAIPGLPTSPNPAPVAPASSPLASGLQDILALLRAIQNPASPAAQGLSVSTPTHSVTVDAAGTTVAAK